VPPRLEIKPPRAWYYRIFLNFRTLVIFLQVDLASSDEFEIVCEGFYETEDRLHGFQFSTLDIIVGCTVRFINSLIIAR
jgi:hypothetical protein